MRGHGSPVIAGKSLQQKASAAAGLYPCGALQEGLGIDSPPCSSQEDCAFPTRQGTALSPLLFSRLLPLFFLFLLLVSFLSSPLLFMPICPCALRSSFRSLVPAFVLSRSLSHFPSLLLITHSPFLSHSHWLVIQIFPSIPGSRDDPFISLHPRPPSPTLSVLTNPSADVIDLHRCVQLWIFEVYAHGETEGTSIQLLTPP